MKEKQRVYKIEHIWSEEEDRWLYIEYNKNSKIVGLNFMQGDEYEFFKNHWCYNDQGLTEYYESMLYTFPIERASIGTLEFINKCMWSFHTAVTSREEYPYGGNSTKKLQK